MFNIKISIVLGYIIHCTSGAASVLCRLYETKYPIATGTSRNHICATGNLLESLHQAEPGRRIIVYNLAPWEGSGITLEKLQILNPCVTRLIDFPYHQHPGWMNISVSTVPQCARRGHRAIASCAKHPLTKHHSRGEYAWKAVIIKQVAEEYGGVLWLDAGDIVTDALIYIDSQIFTLGVYSPSSEGIVQDWTHPKTIEYLARRFFPVVSTRQLSLLLNRPNANGAFVGFRNNSVLLQMFYECCIIRACIAPDGSSRVNHRQDQAVLSVLMHLGGYPLSLRGPVYRHQDSEPCSWVLGGSRITPLNVSNLSRFNKLDN